MIYMNNTKTMKGKQKTRAKVSSVQIFSSVQSKNIIETHFLLIKGVDPPTPEDSNSNAELTLSL